MTTPPHPGKRIFIWAVGATLIGVLMPQLAMWWTTRGLIHSPLPTEKKQTVLILGASVYGNALSPALQSRMDRAIDLYRKGFVQDFFLSGDGQDPTYDETKAMLKYALKEGVPAHVIRTDSGGLSTFMSLQRAKTLNSVNGIFIISQPFHLQRAVWIARTLGMDAQGVCAGPIGNMWFYEGREFGAKIKDFYGVMGSLLWGPLPPQHNP